MWGRHVSKKGDSESAAQWVFNTKKNPLLLSVCGGCWVKCTAYGRGCISKRRMTLRLSIISFRDWKYEVELLANEMWVCGLCENCSVVKGLQLLLFINKHAFQTNCIKTIYCLRTLVMRGQCTSTVLFCQVSCFRRHMRYSLWWQSWLWKFLLPSAKARFDYLSCCPVTISCVFCCASLTICSGVLYTGAWTLGCKNPRNFFIPGVLSLTRSPGLLQLVFYQ